MEIHTILRQLNISLITDTTNPIIDLFNSIWSKLSIVETDVYHKNGGEFIYFIDGGEKQWIFFQDNKNDKFWCNYDNYWSFFESKVNLNYDEIQALTKLLVENALNNGVATPIRAYIYYTIKVENALNNGVATPPSLVVDFSTGVENALNKGVATPCQIFDYSKYQVENALNNGVATPGFDFLGQNPIVENALNNTVTTPPVAKRIWSMTVENALNNTVTTPPVWDKQGEDDSGECTK